MADYEALVGYVHVVSGRALVSPPPGALAEAAPATTTRGRENDTFLALALPGKGNLAPLDFYDQLIQLASELYFHTAGSGVTAGLRELFHSLNRDLYEHNLASGLRYEVHLISAVLRHNELILGRIGQAVAVYQHGDQTSRFPTDFLNPTEMKRVPMGAHPVADMRMTRFPVVESGRLLLGGSGLTSLKPSTVRAALQEPELSATLYALQRDAPAQLSIQGSEFLAPEAGTPPDVPLHRSSAEAPMPSLDAAPASLPLEQPARRGMATGLRRMASVFRLGGQVTERALGQPETEADSWLSFTTAALAVFIVPVSVVLLIFLLWFSGTNRSALEICLEDAGNIYEVARRVESSDINAWRTAWQALLDTVGDCEPVGEGDDTLEHYRGEAQSHLDVLNYVSRQETQLLASLPNARLTDIVLRNRNLFVLDSQSDTQVYHMTLSEDGRSITGSPEPLPYLRGKAGIGDRTLGRVIDIDWSEETLGFGNENVIVGWMRTACWSIACSLSLANARHNSSSAPTSGRRPPRCIFGMGGSISLTRRSFRYGATSPPVALITMCRRSISRGRAYTILTKRWISRSRIPVTCSSSARMAYCRNIAAVSSRASACWLSRVSRAAPMGSLSMNRV